ncbi:MAG: PEP-CTERM sorting domain-containing protein [Terriglobales bacterium]
MKTKVALLACLLAVAGISTASFADSITTDTLVSSSKGDLGGVSGFTFTATLDTLSSGKFTLDFLVQNTTSNLGGTLSAFTLSLLGGGNASIHVDSTNSSLYGWSETDNASFSNGNNSSGCSTSGGSGGWLCAAGPSLNIGPGGSADFKFAGTYQGGVYDPFDLKALGSVGNSKLAVSSYMTPASVPEPSSMLLFASGLSGAAFLRRKRKCSGR